MGERWRVQRRNVLQTFFEFYALFAKLFSYHTLFTPPTGHSGCGWCWAYFSSNLWFP